MTPREHVLELIKDIVSTLASKSLELKENIPLQLRWNEQRKKFEEELETLDASDRTWVEQQYMEWYRSQNFEESHGTQSTQSTT